MWQDGCSGGGLQADGCEPLESVAECRAVFPAGDGCGAITDHEDCDGPPDALHQGADTPMFRVYEGGVSIVVSTRCGPPPGYDDCEPFAADLPPACVCLCEPP